MSGRLSGLSAMLRGDGLRAKVMRASSWTLASVFFSNGLRLVSNMILTRLLFPEAFGLMALVQIFIFALHTFSDIGIHTSIVQNKRGDDPDFLNTAWTLQIIRACVLWIGACLLAWPAAQIYHQPELMTLLPVTAFSIVIGGFQQTHPARANRHLNLGRQTLIDLVVQLCTIVATVLLAWWLKSVWALALASPVSAFVRNVLILRYMPGERNRLHWDPTIVREIIGFGSFIFLSTISAFLINMSDRAILGAYVDPAMLGIYSIGLTMGAFPSQIADMIAGKVLFPLYRMKRPSESAENRRNVFRTNRIVSAAALSLGILFAFIGVWLINLMYDPRYVLAGPMVVLFALRSIPSYAMIGMQNALLAEGDSRRFFYMTALTAFLQTALTFVGIHYLGIAGAIIAPGVALLIAYPFLARWAHRYGAWDGLGQITAMVTGFVVIGFACALHWSEIVQLLP